MKRCPVCTTEYPVSQRVCPTHGVVLVETRELAPGTVFRDTYRIVRVLGRGGMGIVYLAEHLLLDERQALKFLAPEVASQEGAVQRFLREARKARALRDANVVQIYDMGQGEDGSFYIAMEYVEGPSLADLLDASPKGLPVERAFALVRGIAHGLAAAHAKGMVHRDIKPGNVLLGRTEDGGEIAKVADFGIVTGSEGEGRLTRTGVQPLTPEYASPEQWRGVIPGHELDGRTDLYALGCLFFEMLTGSVPFHGASSHEMSEQHVHSQPPAPSLVRPELAKYAGLDSVVQRMMAKAREHRPADVKAFLGELDGVEFPRDADRFSKTTRSKRENEAEASPTNSEQTSPDGFVRKAEAEADLSLITSPGQSGAVVAYVVLAMILLGMFGALVMLATGSL